MPATVIDTEQRTHHPVVPTRSHRLPIALILACVIGIVAAGVIYQPWKDTPFDIIDFSEFLPFLYQHDSFQARYSAFVGYFTSQGRFDLLSYLLIVWKWSIFGSSEAGWQMGRFIEMNGIVFAVYLLLRRLGAGRWGSVAGAALFVVAQTASPAWIRLTMGEPIGLLAIIGAALIATRYQDTSRWRASGTIIAALLATSLLAKEMLVAFVPFVLLLACARHESGELERLRLTRRNVWLVGLVGAGVIAVLVPVAIVALRATAGAYVADYGTGHLSPDRFIHSFMVVLLPVAGPQELHVSFAHFSGNVMFFAIVFTGLWLARGDPALRHRWSPLGVGAVVLAAVGAAIYLPWPYFQDFYGLPFLLGPALLVAIAITSIEKVRPSWRWAAYAACVAIIVQGALYAAHDSRSAIAARHINRALVSDLAEHPSADSIVVAMRFLPSQAWQGRGPTLDRYARAVLPGQRIPTISDALCPATLPMLRQGVGNAMLVTYSSQCGAFPVPARTLRYYYNYLHWPTLAPRRDSLVVGILGPATAQ
jgi:hypothetical protein